jgi:hypothetical protein
MLGDSFRRLGDAGFPPGVNQADYHARVRTLESFARQASDESMDDPTAGSARDAVIRKETAPLLRTGRADEGFQEGGQSIHARQAWRTLMGEPGGDPARGGRPASRRGLHNER